VFRNLLSPAKVALIRAAASTQPLGGIHFKEPHMKRVFADDITILDRYQAFSAEVLRLSLLAVGIVGFLVTTAAKEGNGPRVISLAGRGVRPLLMVALVSLALAVAASLVHRYYSTESMACHLDFLRLPPDDNRRDGQLRDRDFAFRISTWSIAAAPLLLAVGSGAVAFAFVFALA
jgi:hypothetical protein